MIVEKDDNTPESSTEEGQFPVEPYYHPVNRLARSIYDQLASARLAMGLLVAILISCLCGGVFLGSEQAHQIIYDSLWFNSLLVLLVVNTACCFFGRIWRRRITIITFGLILFHLSFVFMFLAIVYNSLFYFDGILRLTEGETISSSDRQTYDSLRHGLLFSFSRLNGTTSLLKVYRGFKVDGDEKNIAYDLSVDRAGFPGTRGTVYINHKFVFNGIEYFRDQEGFSLLLILNSTGGNELHGAHYPLQSFKQLDGSYRYSTGTSAGPDRIDFPMVGKALFGLQADYEADSTKDRAGKVRFQVWPVVPKSTGGAVSHKGLPTDAGSSYHAGGVAQSPGGQAGGGHAPEIGNQITSPSMAVQSSQPKLADGTVTIGENLVFGEYALSAREVRYWVSMNVRYNPGKPVVLTSLWVGLSGLIITMYGRLRRSISHSKDYNDKSGTLE